jgi:nicotinamidase-related amidase
MDKKFAVLIIDMQTKFLESFREKTRKNLLLSQITVLEIARKYSIPIIVVEYKNYGKTTEELSVFLDKIENVFYIQKKFDDAFKETALEDVLRGKGVEKIFLMGIYMDACVWQTAKTARRNGFTILTNPLVIEGIPDFKQKNPLEKLEASVNWFTEKTQIIKPVSSLRNYF